MLNRFFGRNPYDSAARSLYEAAVQQARRDAFYRELEVPDTLDGRFEMICLHVYLLLTRLKQEPRTPQHEGAAQKGAAQELAQTLFDTLFTDMDESLREMGAGDTGVGPRVKKMGKAFYGRMAAYDAALAGEGESMSEALRRNVYGTVPEVAAGNPETLSGYLYREQRNLSAQPYSELAKGRVRFGPPPVAGAWHEAGADTPATQADESPAEHSQVDRSREIN